MITRPEPQQLNRKLINQIFKSETGSCLVITGELDLGEDHQFIFSQSLACALNENSNLESIILDAVSMDVIEVVCHALSDVSIPPEISYCNVYDLPWENVVVIDGLNHKRNFYLSMPVENKKKRKVSDHEFAITGNRDEKKLCLDVNYYLAAHVVYFTQLSKTLTLDFPVEQTKRASLEQASIFEGYLNYGLSMLPADNNLIKNLIRKYLTDYFACHPEIRTLSIQASVIDFFGKENSAETLRLMLTACPNLKMLILCEKDGEGLHRINFQSVADASDCWPKRLTKLYISECYDVNKDTIKCIAAIPALKCLQIRSHNLRDEAAVMISQMKNTQKFIYDYIDAEIGEMSEKSLESILSNPYLRFFEAYEHQYNNANLFTLANAIKKRRYNRLTMTLGVRIDNDICIDENDNVVDVSDDEDNNANRKVVEAMVESVMVNVCGTQNEEIELMNKRNDLLQEYPEYASCIKRLFYQYGLYKYQSADSNIGLNIFSEIRRREIIDSAVRMQIFSSEINKIIPRLEKLAKMEDGPGIDNDRFLSRPPL